MSLWWSSARFLLLGVLCARAVGAQAAVDSTHGNVYGIITDSTARGIAGATVGIVGAESDAITDERGRFSFAGVPIGQRMLHVRAIGYLQRLVAIEVTGAETVDGSVVLQRLGQLLDTMRVVARSPYDKPARLNYTTKYDDFYQRRRVGSGAYYTREQLDAFEGMRTASDIVERIPFLVQKGNSTGNRCPAPRLFVDGLPANGDVLTFLRATDVEAVEYYRGVSNGALGVAGCSLYVWTR
ncbi:MAG: carboxypeptidase-like regulatory domain-containing protein [Gemmatimonadota bacterium]